MRLLRPAGAAVYYDGGEGSAAGGGKARPPPPQRAVQWQPHYFSSVDRRCSVPAGTGDPGILVEIGIVRWTDPPGILGAEVGQVLTTDPGDDLGAGTAAV